MVTCGYVSSSGRNPYNLHGYVYGYVYGYVGLRVIPFCTLKYERKAT